jgi:hypothetical protein
VQVQVLARTAGAWRTERAERAPELEMLDDNWIVLELGPLEPALEGRADARWQAVTSLAAGISQLDLPDYRGIDWASLAARLSTPALDGPGYRAILALQTNALAQLLQAGKSIPASRRNILGGRLLYDRPGQSAGTYKTEGCIKPGTLHSHTPWLMICAGEPFVQRRRRGIHERTVTHPHQATEHPSPVNLTVP